MSNFVPYIPKNTFDEKELTKRIQNGDVPQNAISWAAENGYMELTKSLIALGAPVNENKNYPLELACRNGHTDIVKILLDAGAKTYDSGSSEGYCLRMSAYNGYTTIVKLLLNAGANPMADNYRALYLALVRGNAEIVEMLLDAISQKRATALHNVEE